MAKRKIIQVNYGLASAYDDGTIEINKKLKGKLRKKILDHELRHTLGRYSWNDYKNDFQATTPHFFEALRFSIKNPECLIGYMPIMYSYYHKKWTWNTTALFPMAYFGIIFSLFWSVALGFWIFDFAPVFLESMFLWTEFVITLNVILLIFTDYYVRFSNS